MREPTTLWVNGYPMSGSGSGLTASLRRLSHLAMRNTVQDLPNPCQEVNKDFSNSAGDHTAVGCDGVGGALSPGAGGKGNAQCGDDTFDHILICQSPSFRGASSHSFARAFSPSDCLSGSIPTRLGTELLPYSRLRFQSFTKSPCVLAQIV